MIPVQFSYPAPDYNAIAATQNITTATGAYVTLNGVLSNYPVTANMYNPGSTFAVMPGIQRTIGVFSTGTLTGVVFFASGVDTNGRVVTASFAGASGGSSAATDSFATFTAEFHKVNVLFCTSAATSNFTFGYGATGSTRWVTMDGYENPFSVTVGVITATGQAVTIQDTPNNPNTATSPTVFSHATLVTVTANAQSNYTYPVRFVRGIVTTGTGESSNITTISVQQAGQ